MRLVKISPQEEGQRLDKYLAKYMALAPKSFFYKMLRKKNIKLNGKKAQGNEKLVAGDEISLYLSEETIDGFREKREELPARELDIVFEDEDILVVNKPVGMLSQKADRSDVSLVEYLSAYVDSTSDTFRVGICNRLDRNTSGLVVAGKSVRGLQWTNQLFRQRDLKKYYLCIVCGKLEKGEHLRGYLKKDREKNQVQVLSQEEAGTERIETKYEPLQTCLWQGQSFTLLQVHLITGKSHQIRAHLASIGHPIVGDLKYGKKTPAQNILPEVRYQMLHAWRLELGKADYLPEKYWGMKFEAAPPGLFLKVMKKIGIK
jgi:23S rRNA pseudouridine955/2504/2580 synthase